MKRSIALGDFNLDGNLDIGVAFGSQRSTSTASSPATARRLRPSPRYIAYTNTADGVYDQW